MPSFLERETIHLEHHFEAPVSKVWEAFTQPDLMKEWMWGSLSKETWAEGDLRVGGAFRVYTKREGGKHRGEGWSGMCGLYALIQPEAKLVYTLQWDGDVGYNQGGAQALDEIIAVNFHTDGDGSRIDYYHLGIPADGRSAGGHQEGTLHTLKTLDTLLRQG